MILGLIAALLAPPVDCATAAQEATRRFAADDPAAARLATAPDPRSGPALELRARAGSPTPNMIDRAGLRLTLPPPGTAAQFERIGEASAQVEATRQRVRAVEVAAAARRAHLAVRQAAGALDDARALHAIATRLATLRARQAEAGVIPGLRATQATLEVLAAQDGVAAAQAQVAAARADLARWTGTDEATGACTGGAPPAQHPVLAALDAEDGLLTARVAEQDLGRDLWPDFIEAAWDDNGEPNGRGLLSIGVEIPLAGDDRAGLAEARARARRAELQRLVEAGITAAKARLSAAQAHQTALADPLPPEVEAAAKQPTLEGIAIEELLLRARARRREAALAVEAAQIDLAEAQGISAQ